MLCVTARRPGGPARRSVPRQGRADAARRPGHDRPGRRRHRLGRCSWDNRGTPTSFGVVTADNFALFVNLVLVVVGILTVVFSSQTIERDGCRPASTTRRCSSRIVGMMLMAQATDLLLIFLALETMSIAVYVLTGMRRDQQQSTEAAFKYFLLGAFASSFFLYGIAFLYGVTGSTNLERHRLGDRGAVDERQPDDPARRRPADRRLRVQDRGGAVPHVVARRLRRRAGGGHRLHVHRREGGGDCRVRARVPLGARADDHRLGAGAVGDCRRDDGRRHRGRRGADQPQAHAGVFEHRARRLPARRPSSRGNDVGKAAILFYLAAYALTNLGAFGIIALLGSRERANDDLRDYAGLWHSHPGLATLMTFFLLSLGGFPPTAGFIAKWYVFSAAVGAGYYGLAIIGVLSSVVSVFFYLRIVVMMYMTERDARPVPPQVPAIAMAGLILSLIGVLYLGVLPARLIDLAQASIATIF